MVHRTQRHRARIGWVGVDNNTNGGAGGFGVHKPSAADVQQMRRLLKADYEQKLSSQRTPQYRDFLRRLLCVDVLRRYTAAEALADPWVLGPEAVGGVEMVAEPWTTEFGTNSMPI